MSELSNVVKYIQARNSYLSLGQQETQVFHGFSQFFQAYAKGLPQIGPQLLTFTSFRFIIETIIIPTSNSRMAYFHDCQSK
jgi:hypothetical protein